MSPITRRQVEAWVNPDAWDDREEAQRVIEAILASGETDESVWVAIAGGDPSHVRDAADRELDRADTALALAEATEATGAATASTRELRQLVAQAQIGARLTEAGQARRQAEDTARDARAALAVIVREAIAAGLTERRVAALAGVTRQSVRSWANATHADGQATT